MGVAGDDAGVVDGAGNGVIVGVVRVAGEFANAAQAVLPVLRAIRAELDVAVSVDTRKAAVARAALDEGADVVNDVSAHGDPAMAPAVAASAMNRSRPRAASRLA